MKKIIYITLAIIIIPYIIVSLFIQEDEIQFEFVSNMSVRVKREETGTIETVPFEEYVTGVLAGEMPITFQIEALKAQAVAARTYVMKKMEQNQNLEYDIVDTVMNQVYLSEEDLKQAWKEDYTEKINKLKTAVLETKGQYLSYDNKVAEVFFFSTSVGATENSEEVFSAKLPYLRSVESMWDQEVSPVFEETTKFTLQEFYNLLGLSYNEIITLKPIETTSTGRTKTVEINGTTFTGGEVMNKLKIRSAHFQIVQNQNSVTVTTRGYGHGVGMSQYGAEGMAQNGYTYDEILKYYYQGIEIKKF